MSTRGLIGFFNGRQSKLTYNHSDSYPSELGINILNELRYETVENMRNVFNNIILVNENDRPTNNNIRDCIHYSNDSVSDGKLYDWYVLLRDTQGTLKPYLTDRVKHMIDSQDFIRDSLFCEWAYIVNLKTKRLEVWEGYQKVENINRYNVKTN